MAKKKKKAEEPLSGQIPLEEVATTEKAETNNEPKKKKEKKVSRKNKKAAKKKAAAEEAAKAAAEEVAKAAAEEPVKEAAKSAKKESRKEVPKEESKPGEKAVEEPLPELKEEVAPAEEQQPTATAEETPAPKKKKQSKKSSKKKPEEPIAEELPIVEEPLSEPKEEVAPAEEQQPTETLEEAPAPKKKKQSKKTSKKKEKAKPDSPSVESLLAVEIDAEKTLTLDEAFADIENQLKELEKGSEVAAKETAKKEKKQNRKKKTEEEKSEVLSDEKPKRKSKKASEISLEETSEETPEEAEENLSKEFSLPVSQKVVEETLEDAVAEFSKSIGGEAPKKSFMKEFTIQLNKNSIKEETLGEPLAEEFYVKHDEHKFDLPEKISDENIEELTLFDDGAKKPVETALEEPKSEESKSEESKSEESESTSAEDDEAAAKPLPSLGKLQDIKGEEIDDFIESVETFSEVSVPEKDSKKDSKVVQPKEPETADAHIKPLPRFLSHFVPVQGDGAGEIIRKGFVVICVVLLLVSMGILIDSTRKDDGGTDKSNENELNSYSENFAINNSDSGLPEGVLEKYHSLYNVNNDMVGWLTLPGTPIDMPVVQYTDNEYYETTDFNGNDLVGLVAYADAGSPMKTISRKTILYVSSGEGFGAISGLDDYKGFESLESKKDSFTLSFGTLYDDYEWEIIAGVLTDDVDDTIAKLSVEDFSAFSEYVLDETIYPRSLVSIKSGEKILMLCVPYTDTEAEDADSNEHLVLISKLLNRQSDD